MFDNCYPIAKAFRMARDRFKEEDPEDIYEKRTGTSHFFVAENQCSLVQDIYECGKPGR